MKKILCFGDSNTYGYNPKDGSRFDENTRWTGILKNYLKDDFEIIEEGLNNRTGFVKNPDSFKHCSQDYFPQLIEKLDDVEVLVLAVGTNDLQFLFNTDERTIEQGLKRLISIAKNKNIKTILIPPVRIKDNVISGKFAHQFDKTSVIKSIKAIELYKKIAKNSSCEVFDFNEYVEPSEYDGIHFDATSHKVIGQKLGNFINTKTYNPIF